MVYPSVVSFTRLLPLYVSLSHRQNFNKVTNRLSHTPRDALLACANPLSADTPNAKFTSLADFNKDKNSVPTFYVAIYDVPLNIDKLLFKTHMEQYGPIKSINYSLSKLHYTVHIT